MKPIVLSVFGPLPVWKPPGASEPELLAPADTKCTHGANYAAINQITNKRYDGESVNFRQRYNSHKNQAFNQNCVGYNSHFHRSIRKYGFENFKWFFRQTFVFKGLKTLSDTERQAFYAKIKAEFLYPCETYWIRRLELLNPKKGYNKKESGEGGAGHVYTDEQKARMSAAQMGIGTKPVTRCKILEDGKTHQKVRLTRYDGCSAAGRGNQGAGFTDISKCCLHRKGYKSAGGYLWWFCKEDDIYDKDIMVEWVGNLPGTPSTSCNQAVISKLKLAEGYLEQWHDSMSEGALTLSTDDKRVFASCISSCCSGRLKTHGGYTFRKVTTEKKEDFPDGKREILVKKRKRE